MLFRSDRFIPDRDQRLTRYDQLIQSYPDNRSAKYWKGKIKQIKQMGQPFHLSFKDAITDNTISMDELRGKVVVIDFWATWCGPCRMAMPEIDQFTEDYSDKDVVVISLNVWENVPEKAKAFMVDNEYDMRLMWAEGDVKPTDLFEVTGIPTLVVIDKEGVIRFKEVGFEEGLREKLGWFADDLL